MVEHGQMRMQKMSRGKPRAQAVHIAQSSLLCQDLPGVCDSVSLSITEAEYKECFLTVAKPLSLRGPSDSLSQDEVWMARKEYVEVKRPALDVGVSIPVSGRAPSASCSWAVASLMDCEPKQTFSSQSCVCHSYGKANDNGVTVTVTQIPESDTQGQEERVQPSFRGSARHGRGQGEG